MIGTRILNSMTLTLIGLMNVSAMAQRGSCEFERCDRNRIDGCAEIWCGDVLDARPCDGCDTNADRNRRYFPADSRVWLNDRDGDLSRTRRDDQFDRKHDWLDDRWSDDGGRYHFRPTSFRRYQDSDARRLRDLSDPFRDRGSGFDDNLSDVSDERPFRIPLDGCRETEHDRSDVDSGLQDRGPCDGRECDRIDLNHRTEPSGIGYDPLTPPLPRHDGGNEAEALSQRITARYQNPTTVRTIRSLSWGQAFRLFREVSAQTDARHLEPSSYNLRVRRALRNLALALENPAATQALGISQQSFQVDGFRDSLSRLWDSMNVRSRVDAEQVMRTVMEKAQQVQGMTPGMVAFEFCNATVDTLDKFSALEPSEPHRGPSAALESEMVGIGIEVKEHDDGLLLMRVLRGGPAAEVGLQSGDVITGIDRRSISGMPVAQSIDFIRGQSGSRIRLQIQRSDRRKQLVTLTRRRFRVWSVNDVRMVSGSDVGYFNLSQFAQTSTQEVDQALQQLHRRGMKSLIVDLRGNPGGLLTTCVQITNRFLPCGTIVSTKGRLSGDNMHESATFSRTWDIPLVVLVDGDSASASEIFAAAIQDNARGILVGEKSYGKGTVQTHFPLQAINGNLRLTTARFYAPSGRSMSGRGVIPDVYIPDEDGVTNGDRVLDEAVRIAQSRQLKEMAANSGKCRSNGGPLQRNSFSGDMFDAVQLRTVLR